MWSLLHLRPLLHLRSCLHLRPLLHLGPLLHLRPLRRGRWTCHRGRRTRHRRSATAARASPATLGTMPHNGSSDEQHHAGTSKQSSHSSHPFDETRSVLFHPVRHPLRITLPARAHSVHAPQQHPARRHHFAAGTATGVPAGFTAAAAPGWGGFRAITSSKSGSSPPATIRSVLLTTKWS